MTAERAIPLKLIGYWNDTRRPEAAQRYIDPRHLIDSTWATEERERVAQYLDCGVPIRGAFGYSYCRIEGGPPDHLMGTKELTDRTWIWPEGLSVYVRHFSVRLPAAFLEDLARRDFQISRPDRQAVTTRGTPSIDESFWISWCIEMSPELP